MNNKFMHDSGCRDAVCIDAGRIYDSCSDKDCLEDLRVFFTEREQMVIDRAASVRPRNASVITTLIDIEPLPFNRGYFACDLTFFFNVEVEAITGRNCPPANLCRVCFSATGNPVRQRRERKVFSEFRRIGMMCSSQFHATPVCKFRLRSRLCCRRA